MLARLLAAIALSLLAAPLGAGAQPVAAPAAAPAPLEAYGRLPQLEEVTISPDGTKIAFITWVGDSRRLHVQQIGGPALAAVGLQDQKVRDVRWGSPNHLLITTSTTGRVCTLCDKAENFMVQAYNVSTRKFTIMMATTNGAVGAFVNGPPMIRRVNGQDIVLVNGYREERRGGETWWVTSPFRVNLDTGHGVLFDFNYGVMDEKGYVVASDEYHQANGRWRLVAFEGRTLRELVAVDGATLDPPALLGYGLTPGTVLMSSVRDDERVFHEVSLRDGARTPFEVPIAGGEPIFDPRTDKLLGYYGLIGNEYRYQYLDPDLQAGWARVNVTFKGRNPRIVSWTPDRKRAIILTSGPTDTGVYYFMDFATNQASELGPQYAGIRPDQIHEVRYVTYKAADGLDIPAYLTLPRGREARGLPLVVMPHGGPHSRDEPGFDWWAQALASRGYVVLQPQFRGSDGYGGAFMRAGFGQWGRKMQSDLSDGVRWLAGQGMVDPKRVCIMGASYGGYAAMAASPLEPGVWRCAVAVSGVSDLKRMLTEERRQAGAENSLLVRFWKRYLGAERSADHLSDISPVNLAARYDAPILLIHGKDDLVVPYHHSEALARALQRAGKPVEFVTLQGEDHWFSRSATRSQMLSAAVAFVERHNPPN